MISSYRPHGTPLFVGLDVGSNEVIGETYKRRRHQEVLRFLRKVQNTMPKDREIHIVLQLLDPQTRQGDGLDRAADEGSSYTSRRPARRG